MEGEPRPASTVSIWKRAPPRHCELSVADRSRAEALREDLWLDPRMMRCAKMERKANFSSKTWSLWCSACAPASTCCSSARARRALLLVGEVASGC